MKKRQVTRNGKPWKMGKISPKSRLDGIAEILAKGLLRKAKSKGVGAEKLSTNNTTVF